MGVIYLYVFLPVHIRRDSKASGGAVTLLIDVIIYKMTTLVEA